LIGGRFTETSAGLCATFSLTGRSSDSSTSSQRNDGRWAAMVLSRINSGTATMAPMAPHIQPNSAMVTNTATVLSAQRRLTNIGVMNWDSRNGSREAQPALPGYAASRRN